MTISFRQQVDTIRISEIIKETDHAFWVRIEKTGEVARLSKKFTNFLPGRAIVPAWLAKKIMGAA